MSGLATSWQFARRELRGGLNGFRIFLACLGLGVAAIAAIGSMSFAITRGLENDARAMLGGDVSLRTIHQDVTAEQRKWIEGRGDVTRSAYMRAMAQAGNTRSLVEMKAVDGRYPLYGELILDPPMTTEEAFGERGGIWGAAVDPGLLDRLGLAIGERVRVGDAAFEIRAVIEREPDRTSGARALTLGPRFLTTYDSLAATGLVRPGSLIWYFYRTRLPSGTTATDYKNAIEDAYPDAAWFIRDHTNAAPGIKRLVDRTTLFMTLVGLTTLLVGGVGIANAVRHFLAGKAQTIATLKCIGATSTTIFQVYLAQITVMALVGTAAGLLVGAITPYALGGALSQFLPVVALPGFYGKPLLIAGAFGILTAVAFSLWPLARACEIRPASLFRDLVAPEMRTPRAVFIALTALAALALVSLAILTAEDRRIASWFVGGAILAALLFDATGRILAATAKRIGGVRRPRLRLALANLHRPGAPTRTAVLSLGLGLTVLVTIVGVEVSLHHQIDRTLPQRAPGFFFIDIQPNQTDAFEATVRSVNGAAELNSTPMLRGRITRINDVPVREAQIAERARWMVRGDRGITWAATPPEGTQLVAGDWWPRDYNGPPLISLTAAAAAGFGLGIGDNLTVNILGRNMTAEIANLRQVRWRTMRMNFVMIFSPGVIEGAPHTHLATVRTAPASEAAIEKAVAARFANITAVRVRDVLRTVGGFLEKLGGAIRVIAAITLIAGILVLAGGQAVGHRRRVYDGVVLKVLGATRRDVVVAFAVEHAVTGLAVAIIAVLLGSLAGWAVVTEVMRLEWAFDPAIAVATAFLSTAITVGLGLVGTWRALGQKPAGILRNK